MIVTDKYASTKGRYFTKDMVIRYYKLHEEVKRLCEEVAHLWKYQGIVEEYDGCFAPEDHTSQWQLLMEEHRGEEE